MNRAVQQRGNTLALVIVCIGVIALLVAFFALNYGQFLGGHRQAQTAIDAAALQAARDIGRIVVDDPEYGLVALVDDTPPGDSLTARPVWGLNTLLATARLDLIIGSELGNTTMAYLARQDINKTKEAGKRLAATILAAAGQPQPADYGSPDPDGARDKNGNVINLLQNVENAYKTNSRRLGKGDLVPGSIKITVGELSGGAGETNTPVPQPDTETRTANDKKFTNAQNITVYKPFMPLATTVGGVNLDFTLAAVGDAPQLVDTSKFVVLGSNTFFPSVVKIEADERFTSIAPKEGAGGTGERASHTVHVAACAQAGGPRVTHPSGVLLVDFPQGLPPDNAAVAPNGGNISFASVADIMNSSQLQADATQNTPSPCRGWNARGRWRVAKDGPIPGGGAPDPNSNFHGRRRDDPAVALAFEVYDWLKSCGLRPNIDSAKSALRTNLRGPIAYGQRFIYTANGVFTDTPAYAQPSGSTEGATTAIMDLVVDESQLEQGADPRDWQNWNRDPAAYNNQMDTFRSYIDPGIIIAEDSPDTTRMGTYDPETGTTTVDAVISYSAAVTTTNTNAAAAYANAKKVADGAAGEIGKLDSQIQGAKSAKGNLQNDKNAKEQELASVADDPNSTADDQRRQQLQQEIQTLEASIQQEDAKIQDLENQKKPHEAAKKNAEKCMLNAMYFGDVSKAMWENMQALSSSPDPTEVVKNAHYKVKGTMDFFPVTQVPDENSIKTGAACPTGQPANCPGPRDYLAEADSNGKSQCYVFKSTEPVVIGRRPSQDMFVQPALAQGSVPPVGRSFVFAVDGDVSRKTGGKGRVIFQRVPGNPFSNMALLKGQALLNAPNSLVTRAPGTTAEIVWSSQAMDLYANGDGDYAADPNTPGYSVNPGDWCHRDSFGLRLGTDEPCQALACQWQVNSPMPRCPAGVSCCGTTMVQRADGTLVAEINPCPPPPPRGH